MCRFLPRLLLFCLALVWASSAWAGEMTVTDAWIAEPPPVVKAVAGYMIVGNGSTRPIRLQSASSSDFGSIEIHRSMKHEGMTHMVRQPDLEIEAGKSVVLRPGDYHLMLMQPKRVIRAGERVVLRLRFDTGETVEVQAEVRRRNT